MYILNNTQFNREKIYQAFDMLYIVRKNEFRELSKVLLNEKALQSMPNWKELVLNFCLDVEEAFKGRLQRRHRLGHYQAKRAAPPMSRRQPSQRGVRLERPDFA